MVKIEAVLHPEEAELIWTMLDHAAAQIARAPAPLAGGDSAGSPEAAEALGAAVHAPHAEAVHAPHGEAVTGGLDDSAESPAVRRGSDDSAESQEPSQAPDSTSTRSPADLERWQGAASAEVSCAYDAATIGAGPEVAVGGSTSGRAGEQSIDGWIEEVGTRRGVAAESNGERGASVAPAGSGRPASVLHQRADAARRGFSRADALVSLAQGYLRGDRPNRSPVEITLTIPQASLRAGVADPVEVGELGESFLSGQAARRLSCDAGVVEVIEDDHGTPLSVGRKRRTIAGALKRALHKRDTACTYPGCTHRIFLEGHHIKHWADGGETSLENTSLLCSSHHRYVHEYGYTVEIGPDQRPRFRDPRGQLVTAVPARPAMADLGWPWIRAVNEPLAIDAGTIACGWDGTPVDYGAMVGYLAVVDDLR